MKTAFKLCKIKRFDVVAGPGSSHDGAVQLIWAWDNLVPDTARYDLQVLKVGMYVFSWCKFSASAPVNMLLALLGNRKSSVPCPPPKKNWLHNGVLLCNCYGNKWFPNGSTRYLPQSYPHMRDAVFLTITWSSTQEERGRVVNGIPTGFHLWLLAQNCVTGHLYVRGACKEVI